MLGEGSQWSPLTALLSPTRGNGDPGVLHPKLILLWGNQREGEIGHLSPVPRGIMCSRHKTQFSTARLT